MQRVRPSQWGPPSGEGKEKGKGEDGRQLIQEPSRSCKALSGARRVYFSGYRPGREEGIKEGRSERD